MADPSPMATSTSRPTDIPTALLPLLSSLNALLQTLSKLFHRIPGSPILARYIKSSYQDDPYRSLLEVLLVAFAVRTLLKGRTRGEGEGKNFIKFSEKVGLAGLFSLPIISWARSSARAIGYVLHLSVIFIQDGRSLFRKSTIWWTNGSPLLCSMSQMLSTEARSIPSQCCIARMV
jgi:hypothetical protein